MSSPNSPNGSTNNLLRTNGNSHDSESVEDVEIDEEREKQKKSISVLLKLTPANIDDVGSTGVVLTDIREHDEMIKETIDVLQKPQPKSNWIGARIVPARRDLWCTIGNHSLEILDEIRFVCIVLLIVLFFALIIFLIVAGATDNLSTAADNPHVVAIAIAAVFAGVASILSFFQIYRHYQNWTHPPSQKLIVRILLMVPIYSVCSFISLVFLPIAIYIDFLRQCYEAFVLYSFLLLLTQYLGGHQGILEWIQHKPILVWPLPFCCFPGFEPNEKFILFLKYCTLQYAVITPIVSLIPVICSVFGDYEDGDFSPDNCYVWVAIVINFSQLTSLYALAWLYVVMKRELLPFKPITKFLVVKAVVFFTFWQGVFFAMLAKLDVITDSENFKVGEIQVGIQDFVVCIEMFIAACIHKYTFGYETYADGTLKIIMEQRAIYIAHKTYARAVELAQQELRERDMTMDGKDEVIAQLPPVDPDEMPEKGTLANEIIVELAERQLNAPEMTAL